jgi:hypothetical protein
VETHKPKPWHGPGEFFREYLIIVVGVLTALGGEQAIEWLHRQNELAETREALREEIAQNSAIVALGAAEDRCRAPLLDGFAEAVRDSPQTPVGTPPDVPFPVLNFSVWEVARSGSLSRMPVKERLSYALVYDNFEKRQKNIDRQIDVGLALSHFSNQPQLDHDQAQRALEHISALQQIPRVMGREVGDLEKAVQALGISREPLSEFQREQLSDLCHAAGAPTPEL